MSQPDDEMNIAELTSAHRVLHPASANDPAIFNTMHTAAQDTAAAHGAHEHDIDICACHVHAHVHVSTQDETSEQLQPHLAEAEHQRKHAAKKRARGGATVAVSARPSKRGRRVSKVERLKQ